MNLKKNQSTLKVLKINSYIKYKICGFYFEKKILNTETLLCFTFKGVTEL